MKAIKMGDISSLSLSMKLMSPMWRYGEENRRVKEMGEKCNGVFVEFLYQNGAKLTVSDEKGRGRLHYAALTDDTSVVVLLLRRGAKADAVDADGKDPVQIALDQENGDIVMLLRTAKLKQGERGNVEDMVTEVYKDFEVAVQVDPERMKRQSQASSDNSSRELK